MRKLVFLVCLLAASCGSGGEQAGADAGNGSAVPARGPVQTATLTGLYESAGAPPSRLCITERGRAARFGLVILRNGQPGCSGAGTAVQAGASLRLTMAGESSCTIEARLDHGRVTFPASLPSGCAYYCAPGARAAGLTLAKTGGMREDALRARDIVGDPLCA